MQRILRRHFLSKLTVWILIFAVIGLFLWTSEMIFMNLIQFTLIAWSAFSKSKSNRFLLPEVIYIMPVSRDERIRLTKKMLRMYWLAMGVMMLCITCIPALWKLSAAGRLNVLSGMLIGIQIVMALLVVYPLQYWRYIENTDDICILLNVFYVIVEMVVYVAIFFTIDVGIINIGLVIFAGVMCALTIIIDVWYHKRFSDEMIQFYCEFESALHLEKMKEKKDAEWQ